MRRSSSQLPLSVKRGWVTTNILTKGKFHVCRQKSMVILTVSKHGTMKNIPGPTVPLRLTRPRRKSTARSYSWTIRTQKMREIGKVTMMRKMEMNQVSPLTQEVAQPPSSASSGEKGQIRPFQGLFLVLGGFLSPS